MKTMKFSIATIIGLILSFGVNARYHDQQNVLKTKTFKVAGKCDMCKTRIEKTAKIEGVGKAEWNKETNMLTLVYTPAKVKSDDVLKKIAIAGHDSEKFKADDKTYNSLPGCCKYR